MIENYKKIRFRRRMRKLRLMIFMSLKSTVVLTCVAGFIVVSVPLFSAYEAHIINVTAKIENDVPSIDPPGSYFCNDGNLTIKLYTSLAGASIVYTTNGNDPDCFIPHGTLYTGTPFPLTYSATVKARVCHGDNQSVVASKDYIVTPEYCAEEKKCDALSIGYWQNHEGCPTPGSDWTAEINALSSGEFSGLFGSISGEDICFYLAPSNCNLKEATEEKKLCQAKGKALADLSNVVSNRLDLDALIAGADDGDDAFDSLGLNSNSTVREALVVIENIIINPSATTEELTDAAYVAERIYAFYEEENENTPWCIYPEAGGSATPDFLFSPTVFGAGIVEPPVVEPPLSVCGDSNVDIDEACDDGNTISGDGCSDICQIELPVEDPKDKKPKKEDPPAEDPPLSVCGDSNVEIDETCDDGNIISGDGCSDMCQIEIPVVEPPLPVCGDGNLDVDIDETCDDGNTISGDGCSDICQIEIPVVEPPVEEPPVE